MIRITLSGSMRKGLDGRLRQAYAAGLLRLVRRIQAIVTVIEGKSVAETADMYGVGEQTVRDWLHAFIADGLESLYYRHSSGRRPKLQPNQRKELYRLIVAGPEAAGYSSACWTTPMVADLIKLRFRVDYNPRYVASLLKALGFSFQRAKFISDELDEDGGIIWLEETWPAILRAAKAKNAIIMFADEASFAQWGSLSYTWAPIGIQPEVPTSGKRKGYKVFGLLDCFGGRLYYKGIDGKLNSESYIQFLREVLAKVSQHIIVIQDNASYHTSKALGDFLDQHKDQLTAYQLPPYSPDLNPAEFVWKKVKKEATHLRCFRQFADLISKVDAALAKLAESPDQLKAWAGPYREFIPVAA